MPVKLRSGDVGNLCHSTLLPKVLMLEDNLSVCVCVCVCSHVRAFACRMEWDRERMPILSQLSFTIRDN